MVAMYGPSYYASHFRAIASSMGGARHGIVLGADATLDKFQSKTAFISFLIPSLLLEVIEYQLR